MVTPTRFTPGQQRISLIRIADSVDYLHTNDGREFMTQLECFLVPRALTETRKFGLGPGWIEPAEVVNTAILRLIEQQGRVARYAAEAAGEPWGYLATCLAGWIREQIGLRGSALEEGYAASLENGDREQHLTRLEHVVPLTFEVLRPFTPPAQRGALLRLLAWLAENPPQRLSYEAADCAAASIRFPEFAYAQVSAVMNAVWGGRPKRRETSLFAAFLLDQSFRVSDSPTHARALARFRRAFAKQDGPLLAMSLLAA